MELDVVVLKVHRSAHLLAESSITVRADGEGGGGGGAGGDGGSVGPVLY